SDCTTLGGKARIIQGRRGISQLVRQGDAAGQNPIRSARGAKEMNTDFRPAGHPLTCAYTLVRKCTAFTTWKKAVSMSEGFVVTYIELRN
ncbi:MAG: hypothetical protein MUQ61_04340, partial [OM182 bacterium]|nr:hypothetical protein [OM182 bacterium]